jgi:hypothetical protein
MSTGLPMAGPWKALAWADPLAPTTEATEPGKVRVFGMGIAPYFFARKHQPAFQRRCPMASASDKAKSAINHAAEKIKEGTDKVKEGAQNMTDKVKEGAQNLGHKMKETGEKIKDRA